MTRRLKLDAENLLHANPSLYDVFEADADLKMAQFIHALLREQGAGKKVLDVGSGLGREVGYLSQVGYEAVGVDNAPEMIAWATEHYPGSRFVLGNQRDFALDVRFDALVCVGSTFLYNLTNDAAIQTLRNFQKHLVSGGLLYLDMRNAAFFLTAEGQRWLTGELTDEAVYDGKPATVTTQFQINCAAQILERDYHWTIGGQDPIIEHLRHRLFFPQELCGLLSQCGFEVVELFDQPEPHLNDFEANEPIHFGHDMTGRRMQIIARAR